MGDKTDLPTKTDDEDKNDATEDESQASDSNSSRDSDSENDSGSSRSGSTVSTFSGSGSEQEDLRDYKRGGYHPLKPKDFLNNRYLIIRKLGWGHFSTVWMAFDQVDQDFKALKVVRSATTYTETARDEIELLQHAAKADPTDSSKERIVHMYESFELDGPFGHHVVLVMEITGPSLFSVGRRAGSNGLKLSTSRNITKRVLEGLAYLHDKAKMIHTDLKPENIALAIGIKEKTEMAKEALKFSNENLPMPKSMVSAFHFSKENLENLNPKGALPTSSPKGDASAAAAVESFSSVLDASQSPTSPTTSNNSSESVPDPAKDHDCDPLIKIVDMGNACWTYKKFTNDIQTREYRAFEILMGAEFSANVDVWSLGCIAFELATGDYLFNPRHGEDYATDEDHIAQMIERLGSPSRKLATRGKYCHKFFNRRGQFKCFDPADLYSQNIEKLLMEEYKWKKEEAKIFGQFIESCLIYDPALRPSAATLLNHPFFSAELREDYIDVEALAKDKEKEKDKKKVGNENEAGDRNTEDGKKAKEQSEDKVALSPSSKETPQPAASSHAELHPEASSRDTPNKLPLAAQTLPDLQSLNIAKPQGASMQNTASLNQLDNVKEKTDEPRRTASFVG